MSEASREQIHRISVVVYKALALSNARLGTDKSAHLTSAQHEITRNRNLLVLLLYYSKLFATQETSQDSKICAPEIQSVEKPFLGAVRDANDRELTLG